MPRRSTHDNMDLPDFSAALEETENVIKQCFKEYELDEVFLSFNGGKDCTVLLDITIRILKDILHVCDVGKKLKTVYIRTNSPFRELEDFVKRVETVYGVSLMITEGDMKTTLQRIMEEDPKLKACLMGTRRTDPYAENMQFMQKTDPSWPQILRVSPLLNWSYHEIWSYILQMNVPYCSLYDKGYTSIGSTLNTWPNPALAYEDPTGVLSHLPAWKLADASLERAGRGNKPPHPINGHSPEQDRKNHNPVCVNGDA